MATKKVKRYEGGGETSSGPADAEEASFKQKGLEISNKEAPVGFFERLRMGNIDDPNSEAYRRFGAGRGRGASSIPAYMESADTSPSPIKTAEPKKVEAAADKEEAPAKAAASTPRVAAKETAAPRAKESSSTKAEPDRPRRSGLYQAPAPLSREEMIAQIPTGGSGSGPTPSEGNSASGSELGRNISNALMATSGLFPPARAAAKAVQGAKATGRALSTAAETPVTFLGRSGERVVNAPRLAPKAQEAARDMGAIERDTVTAIERKAKTADMGPKPQAKIASSKKPEADNVKEASRKLQEKAALDKAARRNLQESESKRQWAAGPQRQALLGFAKGGFVRSRGDGIAQRGKTKGVFR